MLLGYVRAMSEPAAPSPPLGSEHSGVPGAATVADQAEGAEERQRRRTIRMLQRTGITIAGVVILIAGVAMLALPGPGWLAIVLGLWVLSLEYAWAERLLDRIKDKVIEGAHLAAASTWKTALSVLCSVGIIVAGVVWAVEDRIPYSGWTTGGILSGSGVLALVTIAWSVQDLKRKRAAQAATVAAD